MAPKPTLTAVPRNYTAEQAFGDTGANLAFIVEASPKSKAGKLAAAEISRRWEKKNPAVANAPGAPASEAEATTLAEQVDEAFADVAPEAPKVLAEGAEPGKGGAVLDLAKARQRVIDDKAHAEAAAEVDEDGVELPKHMRRFSKIRRRMMEEAEAGTLQLEASDVMVAALEISLAAAARAEKEAARKAAKAAKAEAK